MQSFKHGNRGVLSTLYPSLNWTQLLYRYSTTFIPSRVSQQTARSHVFNGIGVHKCISTCTPLLAPPQFISPRSSFSNQSDASFCSARVSSTATFHERAAWRTNPYSMFEVTPFLSFGHVLYSPIPAYTKKHTVFMYHTIHNVETYQNTVLANTFAIS